MARGPRAEANRRNARRSLAALARVWIRLLDEFALYGEEDDDRPRLWLAELERFGLGKQASIPAAKAKPVTEWAHEYYALKPGFQGSWRACFICLGDVRLDVMEHVTHAPRRIHEALCAAARLYALTGRETEASARHKLTMWFADATIQIHNEIAGVAPTPMLRGLAADG